MQRQCDSCGKSYEAKRKSSRFCAPACRMRAHKGQIAPAVAIKAKPSDLVSTTRRELESAGRLDTVLGQQALILAERIDSPHETASGTAALSKEFRAVREAALEGVGMAANPLDELRARRDRKLAGG